MGDHVFVDGGYLRQVFRGFRNRYNGRDLEMHLAGLQSALGAYSHSPRRIDKLFYYDCFDESKRQNETDEQHGARITADSRFRESIRLQPGWHVREGRLAGSRKEGRSQKRVDVLLTVEMMSHAIAKNCVLSASMRDEVRAS